MSFKSSSSLFHHLAGRSPESGQTPWVIRDHRLLHLKTDSFISIRIPHRSSQTNSFKIADNAMHESDSPTTATHPSSDPAGSHWFYQQKKSFLHCTLFNLRATKINCGTEKACSQNRIELFGHCLRKKPVHAIYARYGTLYLILLRYLILVITQFTTEFLSL